MAVEAKTLGAGIGDILPALLQAAGDALRRALERRRQFRQAAQTYDLLHRLDDRTLRDLGMRREEIWSVAAEISGEAERTRIRVRESHRGES